MIHIPRRVYEKFLKFALENANPFENSQNWHECIGLVLGRIKDHEIHVTDIIPIGTGTSVFVDITNYGKVFSLISSSRIDEGEVIVGWAHTHPGLGLFFSNTDVHTQIGYQKMHPLSFGLVLDPMKVTSKSSGFNIYRVDDISLRAFTVDYNFESRFDFLQIKENLIDQLYLKPLPLIAPIQHSNTEISFKEIRITLDGPPSTKVNKDWKIKLKINLPERQFVRLDYSIVLDNLEDFVYLFISQNNTNLYHETISSGTLMIKTFRSTKIGAAKIKFQNIRLSNSIYKFQNLPDMCLTVNIHD